MTSQTLIDSATVHFHDPDTPEEWALSVASLPDVPHDEIVAQSPQIRNRIYKVAVAGAILDAGYPLYAEEPSHALLMLDDQPTEEICEELRGLFSEQFDNPFFEERRARGNQ
jgi:hypothetical protein